MQQCLFLYIEIWWIFTCSNLVYLYVLYLLYRSPEQRTSHFSMTGYIMPLCWDIFLVVGFQPLPNRILTAPRLRVPSCSLWRRTCILWCGGKYHTCLPSTTSYKTTTIRRILIQWTNKGQTIFMGNNIVEYAYLAWGDRRGTFHRGDRHEKLSIIQ